MMTAIHRAGVQDSNKIQKTDYYYLKRTTTPYVQLYIRKPSGYLFAAMSSFMDTVPPGGGYDVDISSNSTYVAVSSSTSPYMAWYKRQRYNLTKLTNPSSVPGSACYASRFSPNGNYLVALEVNSPYMNVYSRSGDTLTRLSDPGTLPSYLATQVVWNSDSTKFHVITSATSKIFSYSISGSTVTYLGETVLGRTDCNGSPTFSYDGAYWAYTTGQTLFVASYDGNYTFTIELQYCSLNATSSSQNGVVWSHNNYDIFVAGSPGGNAKISCVRYDAGANTLTECTPVAYATVTHSNSGGVGIHGIVRTPDSSFIVRAAQSSSVRPLTLATNNGDGTVSSATPTYVGSLVSPSGNSMASYQETY